MFILNSKLSKFYDQLSFLQIDQPELPVVKANFLYSPHIIQAYEKLIANIFTRLAKEHQFPQRFAGDFQKNAKRVSAFEQLFALVRCVYK